MDKFVRDEQRSIEDAHADALHEDGLRKQIRSWKTRFWVNAALQFFIIAFSGWAWMWRVDDLKQKHGAALLDAINARRHLAELQLKVDHPQVGKSFTVKCLDGRVMTVQFRSPDSAVDAETGFGLQAEETRE